MQPGSNTVGMRPGYNNGGMQPGYNNGGMQAGHNVGGAPGYPRCYLDTGLVGTAMSIAGKTCNGRCTTAPECQSLGGRWKAKYCTGAYGCGCCKEIGMHRRFSLAQTESEAEEAQQPPMQVDMSVQWLTPILQMNRCVSVGDQYAKVGGSALYIAMGWDTESGVQGLDIDLSLVALDGKKNVIPQKTVFYQQQAPPALRCGHTFAMRAFGDDRSGDEPGDDELLKLDLACLSQAHPDVEAVVVMVNIFAPQTLKWTNIDSAYMRIISGGQETRNGGNFFIRNAEAVRSYVRLSGNNLKRDPSLQQNGLAVGMFFRQPRGDWAFATLMKGIPGRNAMQSRPHLEKVLKDLVYPANEHWDQTNEQQSAIATGAFGQAGIHSEGTFNQQVKTGHLPCIASRKDQALLMMGHMTPEALGNVAQNQKIPTPVRNLATQIGNGGRAAEAVQQMAAAVDKMEDASTEGEREAVAEAITTGKVEIKPPTPEESAEAEEELEDLFDDLF
mmetsp:Transcript_125390/g.280108  ORF Transcript_125390/g.280108 Transcript_125390/m.280108 type:complete len:500 (+) Transcript_125390:2-1501(+)